MKNSRRRVVIKVGTAVLTQDGELATSRLNALVELIAKLKLEKNYEVILVSSGAVGAGFTSLKLDKKEVCNRQALASIGQPLLLKNYIKRFKEHDIVCSQMLFTADDFDSRKRCKNAQDVVNILLENNVLPIVNENDVIANYELLFGDNDQLAAHVTYHFKADMLIILSDIDGLYDKNPREHDDAKLLKEVSFIEEEQLQMKHSANSEFATGGIVTKLKAADFLMKRGISMYLSSGFDLKNVSEFLIEEKHNSGTIFLPKELF